MKIFCKFPTINISKLHFWLVICIAKNFIWTTLKVIFAIFRFFCTLRFQIYKYCPIITNHTSMESYLFSFQMMHTSQFHKTDPYDWFCGPGSHLYSELHAGYHDPTTLKLVNSSEPCVCQKYPRRCVPADARWGGAGWDGREEPPAAGWTTDPRLHAG